jgi:hypothetical protein
VYSSPNIVRMIKRRGMRCMEHVALKRCSRNCRKICKEETSEKESAWMEDDIEINFKESTWESVGYIRMPQDSVQGQGGPLVNTVMDLRIL